MDTYTFDPNARKLDVEYTINNLDNSEFNLVNSISSWDNPNRYVDSIFSLAGRSIFVRSPTIVQNDSNEIVGKFS
ncbi:MAG: hypothetical protein HRU03_04615 [Nanoarchaeales archaeon]|nr:hypothetical protein [Nanoarchaeales archaeon]